MDQKIGILSDTHLHVVNELFRQQTEIAFAACGTIIHAGDIIDMDVLAVFRSKALFAVHGNMCERKAREMLPESLFVCIGGYKIAVCHGCGSKHTIEERLYDRFYDADCIVYGHTHEPVVHWRGDILYVNPGSFQGTGRYGSPGTYALLTVGRETLSAELQMLPTLP